MLVIGICDGDTAVRIMLSSFIKRYRDETGLNVQVLSYDNGEKLLRHYPLEMDLVFLEIPFTKMNGIEIARRIREVDSKVGIVFLTTILHYVLEAYEVKADNYLIKPLRYSRFLKEAEQVRTRSGKNRFFIETNANGVYKIYSKSIRYIETEGHNTRIHTETDSILSYKRMKDHEQTLFEPYFVRCHTGYIVNLLFFDKLEHNDLVLSPTVRIPVSRGRRPAVLERLMAFYAEDELEI
jgi:DNA-binding LytR/AlgR family response regulator